MKQDNTLPWVKAFFKYITAPRNKKNLYLRNKNEIEEAGSFLPGINVFLPVEENNKYPYFFVFDRNQAEKDFLEQFKEYNLILNKEEKKLLNEAFKRTELIERFYDKKKIIEVGKVRININAKINKTFYFFHLIDSALTTVPFHHFLFKETVNNQVLPEIIKIKKLRTGYYFAYVKKQNNKYAFIKFNDIKSTPSHKIDKLTYFYEIEMEENQFNWINNIQAMDFNESYSDNNLVDIAVATTINENKNLRNNIWYGQVDTNLTNEKKDFKFSRYLILKEENNSYDTEFLGIRGISISTLNKYQNKKKKFFGNITINTIDGEIKQIAVRAINKDPVLIKWCASFRDKKPDNNLCALEYSMVSGNLYTKKIKNGRRRANINIRETFSNFTREFLNVGADRLHKIITENYLIRVNVDFLVNKKGSDGTDKFDRKSFVDDFKISSYDLYQEIINGDNQYFVIETKVNEELNSVNVIYKLAGKIVKNFEVDGPIELLEREKYPDHRYQVLFNKIELECACSIAYEEILERTQREAFKIVIKEDKQDNSKLVFQKDKLINGVNETKQPLVLSNNEIYLPVQQGGIWKLYLFNNEFNEDEQGNLILTEAKLIGTYGSNISINGRNEEIQEIKLLGVVEQEQDVPTLFSIVNGKKIIIFNKNLDKNNNVIYTYDLPENHYFLNNYNFIFKEQNIYKFLYFTGDKTSPNSFNFLNLKFDNKPYSLNNLPYLYKNVEEANTINETFNISNVQSNNIYYNSRVRDVNVIDNKLAYSGIVKATSLNLDYDFRKVKELQWIDNNGNIAFKYDFKLNKKQNENYQLNNFITFKWLEDLEQREIDNRARDFTSLFLDKAKLDSFRRSHLKYTVIKNGIEEHRILEVKEEAIKINNNELMIPFYIAMKEAPYRKEIRDFYYGDKDLGIWTPIPDWEPLILEPNQQSELHILRLFLKLEEGE